MKNDKTIKIRLPSSLLDALRQEKDRTGATIAEILRRAAQEYLQARGKVLPVYDLVSVTGEAHDQYFKVMCLVEDLELSATGEGGSRKKAEQDAAAQVLSQLHE